MREVRVAPNREMAQIGGSHCGGMATAAFRNAPGTTAILVSEVGGPSQGRTGEKVVCLSTGAKERGEEGNKTAASGFRTRSGSRQRGKEGGRGSGGGHRMEGENGKERGGPGTAGDGSVDRRRTPTGGWKRCRATVEGGGT
jgi:hypothetical protein